MAQATFRYGRSYQKYVMKDNVKIEGNKREKMHLIFYLQERCALS